jgi:hypothetical protein
LDGVTLAIKDGESALARKITKIQPFKDGGFTVMLPYHQQREGFLLKAPVSYAPGISKQRMSDCVKYSADDRVKLSIHWDGFVQFSSERKGSILSGKDPATGEIRGLGLMTKPLSTRSRRVQPSD